MSNKEKHSKEKERNPTRRRSPTREREREISRQLYDEEVPRHRLLPAPFAVKAKSHGAAGGNRQRRLAPPIIMFFSLSLCSRFLSAMALKMSTVPAIAASNVDIHTRHLSGVLGFTKRLLCQRGNRW